MTELPAPAEEPPSPRAQFRAALIDTLVYHQRRDIGSCICGYGVDTGHLGKSHPAHVADIAMARCWPSEESA